MERSCMKAFLRRLSRGDDDASLRIPDLVDLKMMCRDGLAAVLCRTQYISSQSGQSDRNIGDRIQMALDNWKPVALLYHKTRVLFCHRTCNGVLRSRRPTVAMRPRSMTPRHVFSRTCNSALGICPTPRVTDLRQERDVFII